MKKVCNSQCKKPSDQFFTVIRYIYFLMKLHPYVILLLIIFVLIIHTLNMGKERESSYRKLKRSPEQSTHGNLFKS